MSLICVTGHQGTGKSTVLNELHKLGFTAYGLDEEKVAGYYNLSTSEPSLNIPQGSDRNLVWRKDNVWQVDLKKVRDLIVALDNKHTFYVGFARNIEDLWDMCDEIIILELDNDTTIKRLQNRDNNSFGKHPGELELAVLNSKIIHEKAVSYKKHPIHFIDGSMNVQDIASKIVEVSTK